MKSEYVQKIKKLFLCYSEVTDVLINEVTYFGPPRPNSDCVIVITGFDCTCTTVIIIIMYVRIDAK